MGASMHEIHYDTTVEGDATYPFRIEQSHYGWAGSGYDRAFTELHARRVRAEDRDEAQLEIQSMHVKGSRIYGRSAGLVLSPDAALKLAATVAPELVEAIQAYHTAVQNGIDADPELYAKAERLFVATVGKLGA